MTSRRRSGSRSSRTGLRPDDAADADVPGGRVHGLALAGRRPVAQAVVGRAEVRPPLITLRGICSPGTERRRDSTRGPRSRRPPRRSPSSTPTRSRSCRRGRSRSAESSRPGRCPRGRRASGSPRGSRPARCWPPSFPARELLVPPGEGRALEAAAGGVLPLGLGRELLAGPGGVGPGVLEGDVDDGVAVAPVDRRPGPAWAFPERARNVPPPVPEVASGTGPGVLRKTSDPGTRSSGSASGYSSGSRGRSATVMYPLSRTKRRKSAAVTACSSIQKPSTDTRRTGRSSDRTPPSP